MLNNLKIFSAFIFFILTINYSPSGKDGYSFIEEQHQFQELQEDSGEKLMEMYCNTCHSFEMKGEDRIAPPMFAIKNRYMKVSSSEEEFVERILTWVKNPTVETALMRRAIERFEVMPYLNYEEDIVKEIAEYIYNNELKRNKKHGH